VVALTSSTVVSLSAFLSKTRCKQFSTPVFESRLPARGGGFFVPDGNWLAGIATLLRARLLWGSVAAVARRWSGRQVLRSAHALASAVTFVRTFPKSGGGFAAFCKGSGEKAEQKQE
jgi:hypothetical protein